MCVRVASGKNQHSLMYAWTVMALVAKMQARQAPAAMKMLVQDVESGFSCF